MTELIKNEQEKYESMYRAGSYGTVNHGLNLFDDIRPKFGEEFPPGSRILDAGCGDGRLVASLVDNFGMDAYGIDLATNCLTPDITLNHSHRFIQACLWELPIETLGQYDYGICSDVMEHIPEEKVGAVFAQLYEACDKLFFTISTFEEGQGYRTIGKPLHITVHPIQWWMKEIEKACPTARVVTGADDWSADTFTVMVEHSANSIPVVRIPLEDIQYFWNRPGTGKRYDMVRRMYLDVENLLAANPASASHIRGGKFNVVYDSIKRAGPIHPLVIGPHEEGPGATHCEDDPWFVVVGGTRLAVLRALMRSTPRPPWMETWSESVRCRIKKPEDTWDDFTNAITLHPPLT